MTTILVVDDEPDFRSGVRTRYEARKMRVLEAKDGVEGFEVFQAEQKNIDLVITDIRMPRMDGQQLIRVIRALDPIVPILGVTAYGDLEEQLEIIANGAYWYLEKPVKAKTWPKVDTLISNAIERHRSQRSERQSSRLVRGYVIRHSEVALHGVPVELAIQQIDTPKPSGDIAEAIPCANDELLFYIADAAGHNDLVPSFMACLASIILHRSTYSANLEPRALLSRVDEGLKHLRLSGVLADNLYLSFFLGRLDWRRRVLTYVNAGHPNPLVFRPKKAGWEVLQLAPTSRPVGMTLPFEAESRELQLSDGDLLFLYTDGASEQLSGGPGIEGRKTLEQIVLSSLPGTASQVVDSVKQELVSRAGGFDKFKDDTTLMALRVPLPTEER